VTESSAGSQKINQFNANQNMMGGLVLPDGAQEQLTRYISDMTILLIIKMKL